MPSLITVQEFARRFGVDEERVRQWIKRKAIPYRLVGPRKMEMIDLGAAIQPVAAPHPATEAAVHTLMERDGLDEEVARAVAASMHDDELTEAAEWRA